jgi:hypothetical protein
MALPDVETHYCLCNKPIRKGYLHFCPAKMGADGSLIYDPPKNPHVSWSFEQPATAAISPALQPTYFYLAGRIRRWERFGYSMDDARSLIEYLNRRS